MNIKQRTKVGKDLFTLQEVILAAGVPDPPMYGNSSEWEEEECSPLKMLQRTAS